MSGPCLNCDHQGMVRVENSLPKVEVVLHIHKRVGIFRVSRRTEITTMSRPAACHPGAATETTWIRSYCAAGLCEVYMPSSDDLRDHADIKISWNPMGILWRKDPWLI